MPDIAVTQIGCQGQDLPSQRIVLSSLPGDESFHRKCVPQIIRSWCGRLLPAHLLLEGMESVDCRSVRDRAALYGKEKCAAVGLRMMFVTQSIVVIERLHGIPVDGP